MNWFKNYFLWATKAKLYTAIYFMAITVLVGLINFCFGNDKISFFSILQILGVSALIALTQIALLPDSTDFAQNIFFAKSIIWLGLSNGVTAIVAHLGRWFHDLPIWTLWAFVVIMIIACSMMLVSLRFEQERDTKILNEDLNRYQSK